MGSLTEGGKGGESRNTFDADLLIKQATTLDASFF